MTFIDRWTPSLLNAFLGRAVVNYGSLVKNVGTAFLAQGVAFVLSILQTLLIPKLLGMEQYGYWQLFIFYCSYVGFAPLGLNDGVYLINGGVSRDKIDKPSVYSQFRVGLVIELFFSLLLVAVALLGGFGPDREFVIVCTSIFLVVRCVAMYFAYVLQAMNETRRSSYSTIVERLAFLAPLLILIIFRCQSFKPFAVAYVTASVAQLVYCCWCCRDFFIVGTKPTGQAISEAVHSIRVGFKLMIANIASQLIIGIARFAIDATWGISAFGELSFALSMVNFFLAFVSQAAMVLFPALRQVGADEIKRFFCNARDSMSFFSPLLYLLYFPLVWVLSVWLPEYGNSFLYFILLIPICVFDSKMNICCTTFFKVVRKETLLLGVNLTTCAVSMVLTLVGVIAFQSITAVIVGVVVALAGRSVWSEAYLTRMFKCTGARPATVGELILTISFIALAFLLPMGWAFGLYCAVYAAFLFVFRKRVKELAGKAFSVVKKR